MIKKIFLLTALAAIASGCGNEAIPTQTQPQQIVSTEPSVVIETCELDNINDRIYDFYEALDYCPTVVAFIDLKEEAGNISSTCMNKVEDMPTNEYVADKLYGYFYVEETDVGPLTYVHPRLTPIVDIFTNTYGCGLAANQSVKELFADNLIRFIYDNYCSSPFMSQTSMQRIKDKILEELDVSVDQAQPVPATIPKIFRCITN